MEIVGGSTLAAALALPSACAADASSGPQGEGLSGAGGMLPTVKKDAWEGGRAAASSAATSGGSSANTAGSTWLIVNRPTATLHGSKKF